MVLVIIVGAGVHVDHGRLRLVENAGKAPIAVFRHVDAAFTAFDQTLNAAQRELRDQFEQIDHGEAAEIV